MLKYGVFSGPYFPIFSPNTEEYELGKAPYLTTFRATLETQKPNFVTDLKTLKVNIERLESILKASQKC